MPLDRLARLRNGSPQSTLRLPKTASEYCRVVAPILRNWSADHDHLREIASHDVLDAICPLSPVRAVITQQRPAS
jgi:hypothetical protein